MMPVEYRCDGACRRILSDLPNNEAVVDEGERKYCATDYQRLTAARAQFNANVVQLVDTAQVEFQRDLWNFVTPPLLEAAALTAVTEKLIDLQPANVVSIEHGGGRVTTGVTSEVTTG